MALRADLTQEEELQIAIPVIKKQLKSKTHPINLFIQIFDDIFWNKYSKYLSASNGAF